MAGAAKNRANRERPRHTAGNGSSSGETSSSGKATRSARSDGRSQGGRSTTSRRTNYDGNRDEAQRSGSRPSSPRPGGSGSRPGSPRPSSPGASGSRDPATSRTAVTELRNMDLPASAFATFRGQEDAGGDPRPPPSTAGQAIRIGLNTYDADISNITVYQYDVLIGNGVEKRGLVRSVWESKAVNQAIGQGFIFDGNKLAWSLKPLGRDIKLLVDLDQEKGRTPRPGGKDNKHRIVIHQTNPVGLNKLVAYIAGQTSFDNTCLEAITFLNHALREYPSLKYTTIKQSFFARGQQRFSLGGAIEAFKGVYSSMRIVHCGPGNKGRLSINIDVANGTFWTESLLLTAAVTLTGKRDPNDLINAIRSQGERGRTAQDLKKFRKLHVITKHRGASTEDKYVIDKFVYQSARDTKFEKDGKIISIYDYFAKSFNVRLTYPDAPLVKMTKGKNTLLPIEVLKITQNQRYAYKLDERQMSNMIKFAVEEPPKRLAAIQHGLEMLDHANDPVLKNFGIKVNTNRKVVDGRLLVAPKVTYGTGVATPGTSGKWDLKGKKFLSPNTAPLKSWAWCIIPGRRGGKPDKATVQEFVKDFCKIYASHGGKIENTQPAMVLAQGDDVGTWVTSTWNAAGNQSQSRPQVLVFILPDKDATTYGRIKRSAECRYGVVSQCMQYAQVQKKQAQYISNVTMKFNSKLGGQTCRATGPKSGGATGHFSVPTLIIGADVSHGAPGSLTPSMAAMTVSMDRLGIRYAGTAETNGYRTEMISTENITSMLKPMLSYWVQNVGGGKWPARILYFRDGVSEGQYAHVMQQEVADIKALLKSADPKLDIPFIVAVGGKRHHVRFFPEKGDPNGNALPGTLVETGVTNPFQNDFYLCAHKALKGTARPMHYHILANEPKMSNAELQTLIYEQSYQYVRSTTPISQHPAIYYAHIVSNRAIPHDPKWRGSSDGTPTAAGGAQTSSQAGSGGAGRSGGSSSGMPTEIEKLMPMPNQGGIMTSMWYI